MKVECGVYMVEKRTLEDVLNDLKEAEKEYKEKCLLYGIEEKHKRKESNEEETLEEQNAGEVQELEGEQSDNSEEISEN